MHKFLIHKKGDHVGVATSDIAAGEKVIGVFMDDDSEIEVVSKHVVPLSHKISIANIPAGSLVTEYGVPVGKAPQGLEVGDYVHTHNMKTARW
jgi:(2R)-sulfolactate sulfo-lyase subunit alpha